MNIFIAVFIAVGANWVIYRIAVGTWRLQWPTIFTAEERKILRDFRNRKSL